ncbi:MAG: 50S ribosomal protein L18 [Thermoguttaceae bacterium]|nr:50S ribosomal protein L18 [Thermoguttaceae bacterium]
MIVEHCKAKGIVRKRRTFRVSNHLKAVSTRPRLCVYRSLKHIYVQLIDDQTHTTIASASPQDKAICGDGVYGGNCAAAALVGKAIAERALAAGVKEAAFDRRGYKYHGRLAALADAARDAGLNLGAKGDNAPKKVAAQSGAAKKAAKAEAKAAKAKGAKK